MLDSIQLSARQERRSIMLRQFHQNIQRMLSQLRMSDEDRKFYQKIENMYFQLRISEEKSKRRLEVSNHLKFVINQSIVQRRVQHQYRRANSAAPALVMARMMPPPVSKQYPGLSIPAATEVHGTIVAISGLHQHHTGNLNQRCRSGQLRFISE